MALLLRLDIDKAYGRSSIPRKVLSRLRDDDLFPAWSALGYLRDLEKFLDLLKKEDVPAHIYFRLCTLPGADLLTRIRDEGHAVGLHAEDTRSSGSFESELAAYRARAGQPHSFTKHGSGRLKLGRRHYPPYEEDKYREWARLYRVPFPFGNGAVEKESAASGAEFFPGMFWFEDGYRDMSLLPIEWAVDVAKARDLVLIVHPENYFAEPTVARDFSRLLSLAREERVPWKLWRES